MTFDDYIDLAFEARRSGTYRVVFVFTTRLDRLKAYKAFRTLPEVIDNLRMGSGTYYADAFQGVEFKFITVEDIQDEAHR